MGSNPSKGGHVPMTHIIQTPTLDRVIETLNDEFPDDLIQTAYELLLSGDDTSEVEDTLAVFIVQEASRAIPQGAGLSKALRHVSEHFSIIASDLRGLAKAIS